MSRWLAITDKRYNQTVEVPRLSKNQRENLLLRLTDTNCSVNLNIMDQELLISLRSEMKSLLTELMSAHPNNFCGGTHGFFFAEPHSTISVLSSLTRITVVDFGKPLSELEKNAIDWPGGGGVVAEYCCVAGGIETSLHEHRAVWSPRYSDEVICRFILEVREHLLKFAQEKIHSALAGRIVFTEAIAYLYARLPALRGSMRQWINEEKEAYIEAAIQEENLEHGEDIDMSFFD